MAKPKKIDWRKTFNKVVRNHHVDHLKALKLSRQLHRLMIHHTHVKYYLFKDKEKFLEKLKMMEDLRNSINRFRLFNKNILSVDKQAVLKKMQADLPVYTLMDRIRLMELLTEVPKCQEAVDKRIEWLKQCTSKDMKRLFGTVRRNENALFRIRDKIERVISDIHVLNGTIEYVENTEADKIKIRPFVESMKWMEPTLNRPVMKAAIAFQNKKRRLRTLLNVKQPYILKNISALMPNMYHYLNDK